MPSEALHIGRACRSALSLQLGNSCRQRVLPLYPSEVLAQSGVDGSGESTFDIATIYDQLRVEGEGLANLGPTFSPAHGGPGDLRCRSTGSTCMCHTVIVPCAVG